MNKKIILVLISIIVLIIVGYLGYRYCANDEVYILLKQIKKETGINFSMIKTVDFKWNTTEDNQTKEIKGKGFSAKSFSIDQQTSICLFFINNGFESSLYNMTIEGNNIQIGYIKYDIACLMKTEGDGGGIEIKCAKNKNIRDISMVVEESIRNIIAVMNNKETEDVELEIEKKTDNHIKGKYRLADSSEQKTFLSFRINDVWRLIYDDNREVIPCFELEGYGFPEEMIEGCKESDKPVISTKEEGFFTISLSSNPTTGYQWQTEYSSEYIELVDQRFTSHSSELLGSGGIDEFFFKALKKGETEVKFKYLRSWEEEVSRETSYEVVIE